MKFSNIINEFLQNSAPFRIVASLMKQKQGLSGRALASLIGVSPFKAHQVLKFLVAQGVLMENIAGRSHLYSVNQDHVLVQKIVRPLVQLEESLFEELGSEILKALRSKPLSIILYGSVARGEETADSDIDILLVYEGDEDIGSIRESGLFMESVTRKYGNPVGVRRCFVSDLQKRFSEQGELIKNIIKEGKVLSGKSITELLSYGR